VVGSLCNVNSVVCVDVLCDMGLVDQLVSLLSRPHSPAHEQFVRALLVLVTNHSRALAECRRPELSLKELLEEKFADLYNQETHLVGCNLN
jgi:hypothetical protein